MATSLVGAGKWEGKLKEERARERERASRKEGCRGRKKDMEKLEKFQIYQTRWFFSASYCFFFFFLQFLFQFIFLLQGRCIPCMCMYIYIYFFYLIFLKKSQDGHQLIGTLLSPRRYTTLITEGQAHILLIWKSNVPYICSYNYWTVISAHAVPQRGEDGVERICIKKS